MFKYIARKLFWKLLSNLLDKFFIFFIVSQQKLIHSVFKSYSSHVAYFETFGTESTSANWKYLSLLKTNINNYASIDACCIERQYVA